MQGEDTVILKGKVVLDIKSLYYLYKKFKIWVCKILGKFRLGNLTEIEKVFRIILENSV